MLVIRFSRIGKKNKPYFRIVVTEKKNAPQSGKFLELVGSYDPYQKKAIFKEDRIKHWLSQGAQISDRVYNLLIKNKVIEGSKRPKKILAKKKKQTEAKETQPAEEAKPVEEKEEEAKDKEEKSKTESKEKQAE